MLIDKKGKLFGLINIIDLFVIIVFIAVACFGYTKVASGSVANKDTAKTFVMKFYVEEVPKYVIDSINLGDSVEDELKAIKLGKVVDIKTSEGYEYVPTANGELKKGIKEDYYSCEIISELTATPFENGLLIEGNKYGVGHTFVIRAGKGKIYLKISGIEEKGVD